MRLKIKKENSLLWLFEPFERRGDFLRKKMFGCECAYFGDRMMLLVTEGEEPWNGLLLPTDRERHQAIMAEFPDLSPHPVLGKWLYLSQSALTFEETATTIVRRVQMNDPRFGIDPKPKTGVRKRPTPAKRSKAFRKARPSKPR